MAAVAVSIAGCVPAPTPAGHDRPTATTTSTSVTFTKVVDGDTIETTAGIVRLIGIDAPERGACGYDEAAAVVSGLLAAGEPVELDLPAGQNDRDAYGRLLRFVEAPGGPDVGLAQLEAGNAVARYDSTDGYPAHPREASYHAAQQASRAADGTVVTVACAAAPPAGRGHDAIKIPPGV